MIRRRDKADGLPYRVYQRMGTRVYSIGYKKRNGRWEFRYQCPADDADQIAALRRRAIEESARVREDRPSGGFGGLIDAWFAAQDAMPRGDPNKRADSTLAENRREAENLRKAFGHLDVGEITKPMAYAYLDACVAKNRPEKGNKEMALARLLLEYAVRLGMIDTNPLQGLRKNKTAKTTRLVTNTEMDYALRAGRAHGGAWLIIALALKTASLCVRRSFEVRGLTGDAIGPDGLIWRDQKDKTKPAVLIEWSPELRSTIDEALAVKRYAGSMLVFGNLRGQKYTKSGWRHVLDDLMAAAQKLADADRVPFTPFCLQDCRPMGVTAKLQRGDLDTQDATLHSDGKMIHQIYDRRAMKRATPSG